MGWSPESKCAFFRGLRTEVCRRDVAAKLKCFNSQRLALIGEFKFSVLD